MEFKIPLWEHQRKAFEISKQVPNYALFFDMGTGKTATTINIIRQKCYELGRLRKTLILGPLIVLENWKKEFQIHSTISQTHVVVLRGSSTKRKKVLLDNVLDTATGLLDRNKIIITNYEAMQMKELYDLICKWSPEILVCDESHRLKNPTSKRARAVVDLSDKVKHKYILTGSPILNTPLDIFNQFRVLDSGETFGRNYYVFRAQYFEDKNAKMPADKYFPKYEPIKELFPVLQEKIYSKAMRVLKSECLDLPPLVKQVIEVDLGKEQKRMYDEMKKEYLTYVKSLENSTEPKAVVAQLAITKALRLQQIVSGYAKADDGTTHDIKDNPRLSALEELLETITTNNKVIVWATFQNNYTQIAGVCKALGVHFVELHGKISAAQKDMNIKEFRENPICKVLIGNQGAAGIGINLVEASYSIFYSRNFSLEHDLQAESRNYRGGSERHEKITRIDIVSPGTIDEVVLKTLAQKMNIAEAILSNTDNF